ASYGTVFKVRTNGDDFTVLHHFSGPPTSVIGFGPWGGLTLMGNTLYGVAENDENYSRGTIFKLNTDGSDYTVLHAFSASSQYSDTNSDGGLPLGSLVVSSNMLYGTAAIRGPAGG